MVMEKSEYPGDAPGAEGAVAKDDLSERMRSMFPDGIPNIYRMLSRNMRVLTGLVALKEQLAVGELSETERLLVALEVANHSDCGYCQAALTHYCTNDLGVSPDVIAATIKGDLPGDRRLALVTQATRDLIEKRGKLGRAEISRYESLGLSFSQILEIIAVIAEYTLATFASNLDRTRIDPDYRSG